VVKEAFTSLKKTAIVLSREH